MMLMLVRVVDAATLHDGSTTLPPFSAPTPCPQRVLWLIRRPRSGGVHLDVGSVYTAVPPPAVAAGPSVHWAYAGEFLYDGKNVAGYLSENEGQKNVNELIFLVIILAQIYNFD
jgi:hypothetical protein